MRILAQPLLFVVAGAVLFGRPLPSESQAPAMSMRMAVSHLSATHELSLIGVPAWPFPGAPEPVGTFLGAWAQPVALARGYAYPGPVNPQHLYGIRRGGISIHRIAPDGSHVSTSVLGATISRINGAVLVTPNVPDQPAWRPSGWDLVEHYVVAGRLNPANSASSGASAGFMLVNPKTLQPFAVGNSNAFFSQSSDIEFVDICFAVWPGPDDDYQTSFDNEYRYVLPFLTEGPGSGGLLCLALNRGETMNGEEPPNPWNPVSATRGPPYTEAYPAIELNGKQVTVPVDASASAQMFTRSYYLRPGIPGCSAPSKVSYVVAGWVSSFATNPTTWRARLGCWSLGQSNPLAPLLAYQAYATDDPVPNHPFSSPAYFSPDVFKGLEIVGDWAFATTGDGTNGDPFGSVIQCIYLPEFLDGDFDSDDGWRGFVDLAAGGEGFVGYLPNVENQPDVLYVGAGSSSGILLGTMRNLFQDHPEFGGVLSGPLTPIDLRTPQEKLLGLAPRFAPQPFVGFLSSGDPAELFDGRESGGSGEGCSGGVNGARSTTCLAVAWGLTLAGYVGGQLRRLQFGRSRVRTSVNPKSSI